MPGKLPVGAIVGIVIGAVVLLLLLVVLIIWLVRRRRAKARPQPEVGIPSPILPLQDPDVEGGYFFGGLGGLFQELYEGFTPFVNPNISQKIFRMIYSCINSIWYQFGVPPEPPE